MVEGDHQHKAGPCAVQLLYVQPRLQPMRPTCTVESEKSESVDNPMHEAAKRGNVAFLNECIANKVSVNSLDKVWGVWAYLTPGRLRSMQSGSTPLHWAARCGHNEVVDVLLGTRGIEVRLHCPWSMSCCSWMGPDQCAKQDWRHAPAQCRVEGLHLRHPAAAREG